MKIVFTGPLDAPGSCLSRLRALRKLEADVTPFDSNPFFTPRSTAVRFATAVPLSGVNSTRINRELLRLCESVRPDVLWMDKAFWLWKSTAAALRKRGIFLVHHITDALYPLSSKLRLHMRLIRKTRSCFDLFFTTNLDDYNLLIRSGVSNVRLTFLGCDDAVYNTAAPLSPEDMRKWSSDLVFVGHHEPRTERGILALVEAGLNVAVYGPGWERAAARARLAPALRYQSIYLDDYARALKAAKIGLSFFSELNYCHTAMRSFETTACGTFLLAMRSQQHLEFFKDNDEAAFFSGETELVERARYYLAHPDERAAIAARGHRRCVHGQYTWDRFMRDDWNAVRSAFANTRQQQR